MFVYDLVSDNWGTIKDVAAALAPVLAALGLRRRAAEWYRGYRDRCAARRATRKAWEQQRAEWYRSVYLALVVGEKMSLINLHGLSVQQACAHMGMPIPYCLHGWERVRVGSLN